MFFIKLLVGIFIGIIVVIVLFMVYVVFYIVCLVENLLLEVDDGIIEVVKVMDVLFF